MFISLFSIMAITVISGEFADVYKGTLKTQGRKDVVAVKVLRVS